MNKIFFLKKKKEKKTQNQDIEMRVKDVCMHTVVCTVQEVCATSIFFLQKELVFKQLQMATMLIYRINAWKMEIMKDNWSEEVEIGKGKCFS